MKTLLIVDDEPIIREGIAGCLPWEELGIGRVLTAADGARAYEIIRRGEADIALTDIVMPELTGLELVEKCRGEGLRCEFIILSSYSEFGYMRQAIRSRVSDYILKPCDPRELRRVLEKMLGRGSPRGYSKPVQTALEYIDGHLGDNSLSLGQIAVQVLYLNADYFGKLFKRECGIKFSAYLLEKRMELARRLLVETGLTIGQIADRCGFGENYAYFSQIFRQQEGVSPSEYRSGRSPAGFSGGR